jgi:hypothetical protein
MMEAIIDEYDDNTAALYGAAFVKSLSKHYKEDMSAIDVIATIVDGRNRGYVVNNKSNGNLLYVVIDATNTFFDWIRMPMGTGKLQIRY